MKNYVVAAFVALALTVGGVVANLATASASDMFPPAHGSTRGGSQG